MITLAIISSKGGTGKTILAATMGQLFSKQTTYIDTDIEYAPRVLLVDMDFHVRGLSFLMYEKLTDLPKAKWTTYEVLSKIKSDGGNSSQLEPVESDEENSTEPETVEPDDLNSPQLEPVESDEENSTEPETVEPDDLNSPQLVPSDFLRVSVLPATNLKTEVDWKKVHTWDVYEVAKRIRKLIKVAQEANFDVIILDTRAGPDRLSLGAALAADLALLVIEQDQVSYRTAMSLYGEFMKIKDDAKGFNFSSDSKIVFVPNKTIDEYSEETKDVLRHYTILSNISFDKVFLRLFNQSDDVLTTNLVLHTSLAHYVLQILKEVIQILRAPIEINFIKEQRLQLDPFEALPLPIRTLSTIPPAFLFIIGAILMAIPTVLTTFYSFQISSFERITFLFLGSFSLLIGVILNYSQRIRSANSLEKQAVANLLDRHQHNK